MRKGFLGNSRPDLAIAGLSNALKAVSASYHGRSDVPAVEQALRSTVQDLFPFIEVSDGHTSTARGIKSLEEVWADLDIGIHNCNYIRGGRLIGVISTEEYRTQMTDRRW